MAYTTSITRPKPPLPPLPPITFHRTLPVPNGSAAVVPTPLQMLSPPADSPSATSQPLAARDVKVDAKTGSFSTLNGASGAAAVGPQILDIPAALSPSAVASATQTPPNADSKAKPEQTIKEYASSIQKKVTDTIDHRDVEKTLLMSEILEFIKTNISDPLMSETPNLNLLKAARTELERLVSKYDHPQLTEFDLSVYQSKCWVAVNMMEKPGAISKILTVMSTQIKFLEAKSLSQWMPLYEEYCLFQKLDSILTAEPLTAASNRFRIGFYTGIIDSICDKFRYN